MSDVVIKVENLSKQYRLGTVGTGTLSHDLNRFWAKVRGKEDPYLKIGEVNDRTKKGDSEYVWALKDIDFEVKRGEVLGIIGRNGAGKSTLLKILSQITRPTTGTVKMKGRVGSLLEVGTGFHPDLTGRENIYINGAILGMRKWEIDKKLDEIIDFAGVEKYIDTPVKRYSSGMMVRLGFSVAAHLEPEILIVDEVLAVGDVEFQKKCMGKMGEVSQKDGRTILFVSHNISAIRQLCSKGLLLRNGTNIITGEVDGILEYYSIQQTSGAEIKIDFQDEFINSWEVVSAKGEYLVNEDILISAIINSRLELESVYLDAMIYDEYSNPVTYVNHLYTGYRFNLSVGENRVSIRVKKPHYRPGIYTLKIYLGEFVSKRPLLVISQIKIFQISNTNFFGGSLSFDYVAGPIIPDFQVLKETQDA